MLNLLCQGLGSRPSIYIELLSGATKVTFSAIAILLIFLYIKNRKAQSNFIFSEESSTIENRMFFNTKNVLAQQIPTEDNAPLPFVKFNFYGGLTFFIGLVCLLGVLSAW